MAGGRRLGACVAVMLAGGAACVSAAVDGGARHAWTASVNGPALHGRGQRTVSAPILPTGSLPQSEGVITAVRWRYTFATTPPTDLQAHLCNARRCVLLPQAEGSTEAFQGDNATDGFVFAFLVPGRGPLAPVLQGKGNQVTVGFR